MTRWTASLPRWLLALEMAVCFVPLTLLFLAVIVNAVHLPSMIHGPMGLRNILLYCLTSLIGPAGLAVAAWTIFASSRPVSCVTSAALGLLALWTLIAMTGQILHDRAMLSSWREFVLFAILPALATCHLMRIDYERRIGDERRMAPIS